MRHIGIDVGFGYTKATDGIRNRAFVDLLFADAPGEINDVYAQGPVGIVDIGYKTIDFVLMQSAEFAWRLSGSIKHGMSVIYQAAISKFSDVYRGNFDLKSVEEAIRDGVIHRLGERIAIDPALLDGLSRPVPGNRRLDSPAMAGAEDLPHYLRRRRKRDAQAFSEKGFS